MKREWQLGLLMGLLFSGALTACHASKAAPAQYGQLATLTNPPGGVPGAIKIRSPSTVIIEVIVKQDAVTPRQFIKIGETTPWQLDSSSRIVVSGPTATPMYNNLVAEELTLTNSHVEALNAGLDASARSGTYADVTVELVFTDSYLYDQLSYAGARYYEVSFAGWYTDRMFSFLSVEHNPQVQVTVR
jgi:hypothetical protein